MKWFYKMFYKYLFSYKRVTKLGLNVCSRCLSRLLSTKIDNKSVVKKKMRYSKDFYLCIKDKSIAEMVSNYVTTDLPDNSVIFESCPGTGVLTNYLLKSNVKSVRVFEDNPIYLETLKKLQYEVNNKENDNNEHNEHGRLFIIDKQILNFRKFVSIHLNEYEYEVEYWFQNMTINEWRSLPRIRFVSALSPKNTLFLRFIIKTLLRKEMFFSYGRTEFFVFVSELEYKYMTAKPKTNYSSYRSTTVLYNTLFDIQFLETIPYNRFEIYNKKDIVLPENELRNAKKKLKGNAKLIRMTPKTYLDQMNTQTLKDYYFFVTQTFMKRKNYVIPFLENWFPDCGPDLIRIGIPVFKYFGDLRPEEVLEIFNYVRNRSDYHGSTYKMLSTREEFDPIEDTLTTIEDPMTTIEDNEDIEDIKEKIDPNQNQI